MHCIIIDASPTTIWVMAVWWFPILVTPAARYQNVHIYQPQVHSQEPPLHHQQCVHTQCQQPYQVWSPVGHNLTQLQEFSLQMLVRKENSSSGNKSSKLYPVQHSNGWCLHITCRFQTFYSVVRFLKSGQSMSTNFYQFAIFDWSQCSCNLLSLTYFCQ